MTDQNYQKVVFHLEQDEDGYPPDNWESLWAFETQPDQFTIDNIPIYVKGISSGDIVEVVLDGTELRFKKLVCPSTNSVFRIYLSDASDVQAARECLRNLGCESEQSHIPKLVAFEIPGTVSIAPVAALLDEGLESGRWEYEEGVLRHSIEA
jgi:hypothetical protein